MAATMTPTPTAVEPAVTPSPGISPVQLEIQSLWRRGPHSKVRIRPQDANASCAKCHSPNEWDRGMGSEKASDCAAALLGADSITTGPAIDTAHWNAVDCRICHRALGDGQFSAEVVFWNQEIGQYEQVLDHNELCRKCHNQAESMDNSIDLGAINHKNMQCTDCHEPHRGTASCVNSGCHNNLQAELEIIDQFYTPPHHESASPHDCGGGQCHVAATQVAQTETTPHIGIEHRSLSCSACHDASGMQVGPIDDNMRWDTWQQVTWNGIEGGSMKSSHNLQKEVDCARCHYEGNPWQLPVLVKEIP